MAIQRSDRSPKGDDASLVPDTRSTLAERCDHCGIAHASGATGDDLRCTCGSLLARYVPGGVELKCRRCKRSIVLAVRTDAIADQPES
jgi:hypothetical protein